MSIIPINAKKNGSLTTSFTASIDLKQKQPIPIIDEKEILRKKKKREKQKMKKYLSK